jgi:transcriptional regulator with XRE-family HTH domain
MASVLHPVAPLPRADASPLGAARVRRRLTVEEVAARSGLDLEDVRSLEEGRIYRFPSVGDALAATLVYATALGISEREARRLAGVRGGRGSWSFGRLSAILAFALAAGLLGWFLVLPQVRDAGAPASPAAAEAQTKLPPPWEIRVDVLNGTAVANAATNLANEIGGPLAYRLGTVQNADRLDYVQTRVYYPPGSEAIAKRLADALGVEMTALPSGKDAKRLLVIVGTDGAG